MTPLFLAALPVAALALAHPAAAQSIRIDPFVGDGFEGFETQSAQAGGQHPVSGSPCLIGGLFGGAGTMCATSSPFILQVAGSTFSACGSVHETGSYFAGAFLSGVAIEFGGPRRAFGGVFLSDTIQSANPATAQWEVRFLDASGNSTASDLFLLPGCGDSLWLGWALPQGTVRVEFESTAPNQTLRMDDLRVSSVPPLGTTFCRSTETSIETRGDCGASGSPSVAANQLTLRASQLPPDVFGFFVVSRDAAFVPGAGGSAGILCLGGSIGRFNAPGQILNSGPGGTFALPVDLGALPLPQGFVAGQPGDTWRFQAWFRDVEGPQQLPTSNFTSGLVLALE